MTRNEAIKSAAAKFDRLYTDSVKKLVADMCAAGRDDDEIAEIVALAIEQYDDAYGAFVRNVRAGLDEHFPVTH